MGVPQHGDAARSGQLAARVTGALLASCASVLILAAPALAAPPGAAPSAAPPNAAPPPARTAIVGTELIAAGDIGNCTATAGAAATAALVGASTGTVATLGDANGTDFTLAQYQACYTPRWGQFLARTRPAPGNQDLEVSGTTGYYAYFGSAAGPAGLGYYSYDLGGWHIVVLNSSCNRVPGGCAAGSTQERWLRADLAAHPNTCTLAYWHRPLFTSGAPNPGAQTMRPLFQALYDFQADIVLNSHNEQYERFAPQTPAGVASPDRGIREFVVGTGGLAHDPFGATQPNSEVRNSDTFGVLKLTLGAGEYSWQFVPVAGQGFTDTGTGTCHAATPPPTGSVLMAAGDIPTCSGSSPNPNAMATAAIVGANPGAVAVVGDIDNDHGEPSHYVNCYGPSWGRYRDRTRPVPGNHDYMTPGAAGYYAYWGPIAGPSGLGYYSYTIGSWHIVAINANCAEVPGGCGAGSPQETWLRQDLAAHPALCTLAYWHQPLFTSSAVHGPATNMRPMFTDLFNAHVEVVLGGHNHQYERFAPQTPTGTASAVGVRQFVIGTGGKSHYAFGTPRPNSEVRNNTAFGVLKLTLNADSYSWRFIPVPGQTFTDSGTTACH